MGAGAGPSAPAAAAPPATATVASPPPANAAEAAGKPEIGSRLADLEKPNADFETYLDRLMMAESGGRAFARNPRSTALGPYQFIRSTFLAVTRRYMPEVVEGLTDPQILALRTDRDIARRAAAAYTRETAAVLHRDGHATTYGNLRLAFLVGAEGASRVLAADPDTPVVSVLGPAVVRANPFMGRMTTADLIARTHRDVSMDPAKRLATDGLPGAAAAPSGPRVRVRCNLSRASCRRWLALEKQKLRKPAAAAKPAKARSKGEAKPPLRKDAGRP